MGTLELNENKCEGLSSIRDLDDYMNLDEKNHAHGRRKNKIYSLGDAITVRVARANLEKKQLILLIENKFTTKGKLTIMENLYRRKQRIESIILH